MNNEKPDQEKLEALIIEHRRLDDEADKLSNRKHLFPSERTQLKILKVKRLMARDAIDRIRSNKAHEEPNSVND